MISFSTTEIDAAKFGSLDIDSFYFSSSQAWAAGEPAELIKPISITNSGGTASIGTNGQVTFSGVTSLSLNGVFSADFDNYVIAYGPTVGSGDVSPYMRYRASGTDNSTASSYTFQELISNTNSVSATRESNSFTRIANISSTTYGGHMVSIYGPYLAQPTAHRSVSVRNYLSATLQDWTGTHNQSTSYDGCTIYLTSGTITGKLAVYGIRM